jgi:hypothetical protein
MYIVNIFYVIMGSKEFRNGIKRKHVTLTIIKKLKVIENGVPGKKFLMNLVLANKLCQILKHKKNL